MRISNMTRSAVAEMLKGNVVDLEKMRAAVSALFYESPRSFSPTHINRIRNVARLFGAEQEVLPCMQILRALRECEDIGHGYWVPTPLRIVPIPSATLLVSSSPITALRKEFGDAIDAATAGRLVVGSIKKGIPIQSMHGWMGVSPNLGRWMLEKLKFVERDLKPTLNPVERTEAYVVGTLRSKISSLRTNRVWNAIDELPAHKGSIITLCRVKDSIGTRWFFGEIKDRRIVRVSNSAENPLRLMYGLHLHFKSPLFARPVKTGDYYSVSLRLPLPEEERRLFIALGAVNESNKEVAFHQRFITAASHVLQGLGYHVEEMA